MITKRDGEVQEVNKSKLKAYFERLTYDLKGISADRMVAMVLSTDAKTTSDIQTKSAEIASCLEGDYPKLAGRIAVTLIHKNTKKLFSVVYADLAAKGLVDDGPFVESNAKALDSALVTSRDFNIDYNTLQTLRSYGLEGERPQHTLMRRALQESRDVGEIIQEYNRASGHI